MLDVQSLTIQPIFIDVVQYKGTEEHAKEVVDWVVENKAAAAWTSTYRINGMIDQTHATLSQRLTVFVNSSEIYMDVEPEDWVILGNSGFEVLKTKEFEEKYKEKN